MRYAPVLGLVVLGLLTAGRAAAQPIPPSDVRGAAATLVVFYRSADDARPFELNLALSERWPEFQSRGVRIIDAGPPRFDPAALARQFSVPSDVDFAAILLDSTGSPVLSISESPVGLERILSAVDRIVG